MRRLAVVLGVVLGALLTVTPAATQWLRHPTADIPRNADGRPNLRAPAPRTAQGKPVIAGLWRPGGAAIFNIASALKPGETIPYQPWAAALAKERAANNGRDDPTANCIIGGVPRSDLVPYPFKIVETPGLVLLLYEAIHSYRQIFTDAGRCRAIRTPPGLATRSGDGMVTSSSWSRLASTTTSGWTTTVCRQPRRCA